MWRARTRARRAGSQDANEHGCFLLLLFFCAKRKVIHFKKIIKI